MLNLAVCLRPHLKMLQRTHAVNRAHTPKNRTPQPVFRQITSRHPSVVYERKLEICYWFWPKTSIQTLGFIFTNVLCPKYSNASQIMAKVQRVPAPRTAYKWREICPFYRRWFIRNICQEKNWWSLMPWKAWSLVRSHIGNSVPTSPYFLQRHHMGYTYSRIPGHRNWQIKTAAWSLAGFLHFFLETRWQQWFRNSLAVHIYIYIYLYIYTHTYIRICVYIFINIYIYICVCVCVVYVSVYITG